MYIHFRYASTYTPKNLIIKPSNYFKKRRVPNNAIDTSLKKNAIDR